MRPKRPSQDGSTRDVNASQSARAAAVESTETRQVLMQRVIALNGVPEGGSTKPLAPEPQLPQHILNANIEDAVTQQYHPVSATRAMALGTSISDLASLDRALESAGVLEAQELAAITHFRPPSPQEASPPAAPPLAQAAPAQPQPHMLLVPMSIVWTVLTVFSVCALALTFIAIFWMVRAVGL